MHRALSTENLAYFAQSTLHSIRRIISSSSSSDEGDLASLTKHMEERCVGGFALDPVKSVAWVSLLQSELHALAHPPAANCVGGRASISQKGGGGLTSSAASSVAGCGTSHAHKDPFGGSLSMSPRAGSGNNNNTNSSDNTDTDANQLVGASAAVARAASLPSSTDGTPVATATGKPPVGNSSATVSAPTANSNKKRPNEATLLSALECVKLVYRIYSTDAIALFSEHRLFVTMAELLQTNSGTRKLYEALTNTLVAFSAERTLVFADLAETIISAIETIPTPQASFLTLVNDDYGSSAQQQQQQQGSTAGKITSYALVPKMRLLLFVSNALKRADLVDIEHSNETKSLLVEMGAMSKILNVAEAMRGVVEHPASDENPQVALALGVLLMSVLAGLVRSNVPNKDELRKDAHVFELWTFFANHVGRMEGPFSYLLDGSDVHDQSHHHHHTGFHIHSQVSSPTASTSNNTFMLGNAHHRRQLSGSGIFGSAPSSTSNPNLMATPGPEGKDGLGSPQQPQGAAKGGATTTTTCVYRIAEKLQVLTLEPPSVWASDLVEFLTELCTSDSFSLNRQSLYAAQDAAAGITSSAKSEGLSDRGGRASPRAMAMGVAATATAKRHAAAVTVVGKATTTIGSSVTALDPFGGVRKWEVLPANWDAMVSDSLFIWRLVSAATVCTLTTETTCQLLRSICGLDMSAPYADFVFRAMLSNLIILFRASPMNAEAIVEADTFRKIISTMTAPATVLVFQDIEKPRACVKLGQPNWAVCMALLTVIMHTSPRRCEVATLMRGVGDMATNETAAEDCEIIEHLLQVLASSTYPPGNTLWLSASSASVACPVERFAGRWYGYTYLGWVNPLCIWQGGSHLVSWADPSGPSSVVVTIVANGRKKCLSVCHTSGQESSVSLLTDSTLTDGWNHIAIVHNISGFTVFINGQKRSCGNVPFPKEPSKPHRLCFHFGGSNGDLGVKPFFGFMTQPQLMDGAVPDKDIERLAAAGAGSNASSVEPGLSILPLLTIDEQISGSLASTSASLSSLPLDNYMTGAGATLHQQYLRDVFVHKAPNMSEILQSEGVLEWFLSSITNASEYSNRNSVAILCLEMLIAYARLVPNGLNHINEKGVLTAFSRDVLSWDSIPYHLPPVVVGLVQVGAESRRLFNHPISLQVLTFLADMIASPNCPPLTKNQIFRDLSSLLGEEHNRKLFKDGPSLTAILSVCSALQRECIDDCVILIEKLVRDNAEMDSVLKFLAFEKQQQLMRCDILRMLYEVGQSDAQILDALASANAVPILIYIIGDVSHQSENLRAYAIRLLALVLVMNRKQRDVFVRVGGFDTFAAAMSQKKSLSPITSVTSAPFSVSSPALAITNASVSPSSSSASPLSAVPLTNVILGAAASQLPYPPHAMPSYAYPLRLTTFNFLFKFALGFFQPMEFSKDGLSRSQQFAGAAPATRPPMATAKGQPISAMNGHLPSLIPRRDLSRRQISMDLASLHSDPDARLTIDDTYNSQSHSNKTELLHAQLLQTIFALLPFAVESSLASSSPSFVNSNTISANGNSGRRHGAMAARGAATHIANGGTSTQNFNNPNSNSNSSSMFAGTRRPSVGGGVEDAPTAGSSPASAQDTPPLANVRSPTEMGPRGGSGVYASAENSGQLPSSPHGSFNTGGNYNFNGNVGNIPVTGRSADAVSECGSGSTTARRAEEEQYATVLKVLAFADRVFDINRNADIVLLHPWMEWLWCGVAPFFPEGGAVMMGVPASVAASVETYTRSIIRKICIADLVKSRSNSNIKRVKDLTEMPTMQRMVVEEVLRHFSTNNRLDVLQQEEATNVLRNLDSLLLGIDESISPFPLHLGIEVAHSLAAITVNNNAWVRTRVRSSTKLLETRDRLCFLLLSSGWQSFKKGPADRIAKILQANAHDPNSTLLVLKYIVEAVADRDVESVEALQAMLQQLQTLDPEQRRALGRAAADDEVIKILLSPPPPPMTSVVSSEASGGGKSPTDTKNPTTKPGEGGANTMGEAPVSSREGTPLSDQAVAAAAAVGGQKAMAAGSASTLPDEEVTGTTEGTTFIQWCISHVAKWEATAAKITKACKALDESTRSQSEKSQREFAAKVKVRKGELERRAQQQYKSAVDYEKLCADVESKRASHTDAISLAHTKRKDRDEKRQSLAARTNSSAPSAGTTGGDRTSSAASVNSRNVSIVA